jgi:hypothetical protein
MKVRVTWGVRSFGLDQPLTGGLSALRRLGRPPDATSRRGTASSEPHSSAQVCRRPCECRHRAKDRLCGGSRVMPADAFESRKLRRRSP